MTEGPSEQRFPWKEFQPATALVMAMLAKYETLEGLQFRRACRTSFSLQSLGKRERGEAEGQMEKRHMWPCNSVFMRSSWTTSYPSLFIESLLLCYLVNSPPPSTSFKSVCPLPLRRGFD